MSATHAHPRSDLVETHALQGTAQAALSMHATQVLLDSYVEPGELGPSEFDCILFPLIKWS